MGPRQFPGNGEAQSRAFHAVLQLGAHLLERLHDPRQRFARPEDAFDQLEQAAAYHERLFAYDAGDAKPVNQIETMIAGVAVFDYNNDGKPDLFFANGAELPSFKKSGPKYWNRLYRNDGDFKFTDVTEKAGLAGEGYAFGAAAADFASPAPTARRRRPERRPRRRSPRSRAWRHRLDP